MSMSPSLERPIAQQPPEVRSRFMTRVYIQLMVGIAGFIALSYGLFVTGLAYDIAEFVLGTSWLIILGGFMIVSWMANSWGFRAETTGAQYGAYALLVVANALLFATPLVLAEAWDAQNAAAGATSTIEIAAQISLFAFAALSFIAIRTGKDFSFLRGILMWGGVLALVLIVASVIFGTGLGTWFSVAMIGFAGAAILYDTQKIYTSYPPNREVAAAMSLFASLALLFWYVLQLLTRR
jgi:uncharacterized protein